MRTMPQRIRPLLGIALLPWLLGCAAHRAQAFASSPESLLEAAEGKIVDLEAENRSFGQRLDAAVASVKAAESDRDHAQAAIRDRDARLAAMTGRYDSTIAELQADRANALRRAAETDRRLGISESELRERSAELASRREQLQMVSREATELRSASDAAQARVRALERDIARLTDRLHSVNLSRTVLTAVLGALLGLLALAWAAQYLLARRTGSPRPDLLSFHITGGAGRGGA